MCQAIETSISQATGKTFKVDTSNSLTGGCVNQAVRLCADDLFYQFYRHAWTLDPGYKTRRVLYNLYHILNHYKLFGGGYAQQALDMVDSLISETP